MPLASMCRKTISTPIDWLTAPRGVSPTRREATKRSSNGARRCLYNRVVFEPTGPYHRAVERALGVAGVPFVKVNPRQTRRFAEATGKLANTDRLDGGDLARMGALLELQARPATSGSCSN
jgi:transposase